MKGCGYDDGENESVERMTLMRGKRRVSGDEYEVGVTLSEPLLRRSLLLLVLVEDFDRGYSPCLGDLDGQDVDPYHFADGVVHHDHLDFYRDLDGHLDHVSCRPV